MPASGAEKCGLYPERGLGRGLVASWSRGGSRALHLEGMQKRSPQQAPKIMVYTLNVVWIE
eukprot:7283741-Pyramimonas_sp.AAC.1